MGFFLDPLYIAILAPGLILSLIAQAKVSMAFKKYKKVPVTSGLSGAQAAANMLRASGISDVGIEQVGGVLSDHYDPTKKVLRLSPDVYDGRSVAALGIACHEAGHALQHAKGYTPLYIRTALVPVASFGSQGGMYLLFFGVLLQMFGAFFGYYVALLGFYAFSAAVVFTLVTLPVEFDASRRAKVQLAELGMLSGPAEQKGVKKVLSAAALTYVAAAITALLTLFYYAMRLGLIGGGDD